MLQSESMSKFMGQYFEIEVTSDQGIAPVLSPLHPGARTKPTIKSDLISAIVNDDQINVRINIKYLPNLDCTTKCIIKIVAIRVLPIHVMNHWLTLGIGLKTKCSLSVSVRTHLPGIKGLHPGNIILHLLYYIRTEGTVIR